MNKGDLVVCIKTYIPDKNDGYGDNIIFFKSDRIYQITDIGTYDDEDYITINGEKYEVSFYIDKSIQRWLKFSDYFITLAEWRDKQIDSILEDE